MFNFKVNSIGGKKRRHSILKGLVNFVEEIEKELKS
jgi:hypothetical protein